MQINVTFLIYTISIGLFMAIHFTSMKMLKGNPNESLFWSYLVSILLIFIINYFTGDKVYSENLKSNIIWIIAEGILIIVFPYLIIKGFQSGLNPVIFPLSNTAVATIFLFLINYLFFRSSLNIYNISGLLFGIFAIYLLSIKG